MIITEQSLMELLCLMRVIVVQLNIDTEACETVTFSAVRRGERTIYGC